MIGGIVASDSILFRQYLQRDLSALSRIVAENSTAALAFNDPRTATETLAALRARPHLVTACIYRPDGTILARYSRQDAPSVCPPLRVQEELQFGSSDLTVSRAIVLSGRRIGTLMMVYDLEEIAERMRIYSATVLAVLLFSSLIAFLISAKLDGLIATPVSRLVRATTSVSETSDYSIRAQKFSGDEFGTYLVDRFNGNAMGWHSESGRRHLRNGAARSQRSLLRRRRKGARAFSIHGCRIDAAKNLHGNAQRRRGLLLTASGLNFSVYLSEEIKNVGGGSQFVHPDDIEENIRSWRLSVWKLASPFLFSAAPLPPSRWWEYSRWHLSRAHAMRDAAGNISMWIASNTDIHEQKQKGRGAAARQ